MDDSTYTVNEHTPQFLSIKEKRAWLARIFRDTSGEYSEADKFKVLREDNRLVMLSKLSTGKETHE